ncbi:MAG: serine/threonine protein kinase, partial [Planctomycetota bacterium]
MVFDVWESGILNSQREIQIGKIALQKGMITIQQFREALQLFQELEGQVPFLGILIQKQYITLEQSRSLEYLSGQMDRVGNYQLLAKIGEGGMGVVYKVRHLSTGEIRAMKILQPRIAQDLEYLERFLREAKVSKELEHPGVVKCFEVEKWNTTFYMVMEYVEGSNLAKILRQKRVLQEEEALRICQEIASILVESGEKNIVHRDIKPENILVESSGRVRLTDFGLAKILESREASLTQTGTFLGTPVYISPEQARGMKEITVQSDVYSLGITLFEMVTGNIPFDDPSSLVICQKHLVERLPNPRSLNPHLSKETSRLIRMMTAKQPTRRPTPRELVRYIQMIFEGTFQEQSTSSSALITRFILEEKKSPRRSFYQGLLWGFLAFVVIGSLFFYFSRSNKNLARKSHKKAQVINKASILIG